MTAIRDELNRLLSIHFGELWVPTETALQELEHFGDDLIPGLIDCLEDPDEDLRRLAVTLLAETRPRSNAAVPQLIELLNDEDMLVAVLTHIADFGPLAVGAVLYAGHWSRNPTGVARRRRKSSRRPKMEIRSEPTRRPG